MRIYSRPLSACSALDGSAHITSSFAIAQQALVLGWSHHWYVQPVGDPAPNGKHDKWGCIAFAVRMWYPCSPDGCALLSQYAGQGLLCGYSPMSYATKCCWTGGRTDLTPMLNMTDFSTRSSLAQGGALAALRTQTTASLSARRDATSRRMPCRMCSGLCRASAALPPCLAAAAIRQRPLSSRQPSRSAMDPIPGVFEGQLGCCIGQEAMPDVQRFLEGYAVVSILFNA